MAGSELDVLRGEHQQISARMFRIAGASIVVLFVAVMAFTRALRRVDGDEVTKALLNIQQASSIAQRNREDDLSYVFRAAYKALDPLPAPATPPDQAAVQQASRDSDAAVAELEKRASEWFTVKMPLIGADLLIDLRYWIAVVPLLLWFASAWLWIANAKLRVIEELAARQITTDAAPINRLLFQRDELGSPPAFAHYPARAQSILFIVGVALLLSYAVIGGWTVWAILDLKLAFITWLFLSWYVAMYAYRASSRIQRQAEELFTLPRRRGIVGRVHDKTMVAFRAVLAPLRRMPRSMVAAGAVIVLSSLFTSMATSCASNDPGGPSRKGYELVLGQRAAMWFTDTSLLDTDFLPVPLGRSMYTLSVGMSVMLLLMIAIRRQPPRRLTIIAHSLSICASVFIVVEIGFVAVFGLVDNIFRLLVIAFVYYVWWRARRSKYADPRRWEDVRAGLVGAVVPLVALAPMWAAEIAKRHVWGLYVYATGALITTVGLSALLEEGDATEAANSPAAPALAPAV